MFHASWAAGHNSTNYEKFYAAPPGSIYRVVQYQASYEPYVILKREGPPWCVPRFPMNPPPVSSLIKFSGKPGVMKDLSAMEAIRLPVFLRCICLEFHTSCWPIIS